MRDVSVVFCLWDTFLSGCKFIWRTSKRVVGEKKGSECHFLWSVVATLLWITTTVNAAQTDRSQTKLWFTWVIQVARSCSWLPWRLSKLCSHPLQCSYLKTRDPFTQAVKPNAAKTTFLHNVSNTNKQHKHRDWHRLHSLYHLGPVSPVGPCLLLPVPRPEQHPR